MKTELKHLKRWSLPSSYFGAQWPDYYVFLGRNRDSDCLTNSNFEVGLKALGGEQIGSDSEGEQSAVEVVRENHWACGWIEWIAIHESQTEKLVKADEMLARIESYPVLDENDWSARESEEANEVWRNCYSVRERVEYIRRYRDQFDFRGIDDAKGCLRGEYFAGYAGELISR